MLHAFAVHDRSRFADTQRQEKLEHHFVSLA